MIRLRHLLDENYVAFTDVDRRNIDAIINSYVDTLNYLITRFSQSIRNSYKKSNAMDVLGEIVHDMMYLKLPSKVFEMQLADIGIKVDSGMTYMDVSYTVVAAKPYEEQHEMLVHGSPQLSDLLDSLSRIRAVPYNGLFAGASINTWNGPNPTAKFMAFSMKIDIDVMVLLHAISKGVDYAKKVSKERLVSLLRPLIEHEYTHILQIARANSINHSVPYQAYKRSHANSSLRDDPVYAKLYLGAPTEIAAFSRQAATELRMMYPDKSANEILKILQSGKIKNAGYGRRMPALSMYSKLLKNNSGIAKQDRDTVLNRFYKTLYQLLSSEES